MATVTKAGGKTVPLTAEELDRCTLDDDINNLRSKEGGLAVFGATSLARKLGSGTANCVDVLAKRNGGRALVAALQVLPRDHGAELAFTLTTCA